MTEYRHIIWDWNGTLLDDAWLCVEIVNGLLRNRHKPCINHKQYQEAFDFPIEAYYRKVGFDFSIESFESVATEFIVEYDKRRFECKLQDNAIRVLEACAVTGFAVRRSRPLGFAQSILSAYSQKSLKQIVDFFQIRHFFTTVSGLHNHYAASKLRNGERLLKKLSLHGSEVLLVGDTVHDFEVAKAIGTHCVLIPSGHHSREKLESCGVPVLSSLTEVLHLL